MARAHRRNDTPRPFLKWAGGKRALLDHILPRLPRRNDLYYEPFLGGGAVFLALARVGAIGKAVLGDSNPELVNAWVCVKEAPDDLIAAIERLGTPNKTLYYEVRAREYTDPIERAARMLWLNRTCFNGLYRLNRKGQFNVPYGRYAKPQTVDADNLRAVSKALNDTQAEIRQGDFDTVLPGPEVPRATVYLDPPYMPVSSTSNFTSYDRTPFGLPEHARLADAVLRLKRAKHRVLLSNSITPETEKLYRERRFNRIKVGVRRPINRDASKRGKVGEFLVGAHVRLRGRNIPEADWLD